MDHDINCECCSDRIGGSIPIVNFILFFKIIFPIMTPYTVPSLFNNNWQPQVMPATNLAIINNFNNFNLSNLSAPQQYPPSNYPPNGQQQNFAQGPQNQQNYGQGPQNYGQGVQNNMGQTPGYGNVPQQNYGQGSHNNMGQQHY